MKLIAVNSKKESSKPKKTLIVKGLDDNDLADGGAVPMLTAPSPLDIYEPL
jgi:hypothetical protein